MLRILYVNVYKIQFKKNKSVYILVSWVTSYLSQVFKEVSTKVFIKPDKKSSSDKECSFISTLRSHKEKNWLSLELYMNKIKIKKNI